MKPTAPAWLAGLALLAAPAAAAAPAPVDPAMTERGPNPRVARFDRDTGVLHAEGREIRFDLPGTVWQVRSAAHGYLLERSRRGNDSLHLLRGNGESRRLAQRVLSWEVATGTGAGRRVAVYRGSPEGIVVDVVRVADGSLVARRKAYGGVFDYHNGKVWLAVKDHDLATWDPDTGKVTRKAGSPLVVDARHGAMAHRKDGCVWIAPIRTDAGWDPWCSGEAGVFSWSPDGRRVLTHTIPSGDNDGITRNIVVRNARTGKKLRTFTGYFSDGYPDPRWESGTAFLVAASDPQDHNPGEAAVMRLHLDGTVERASRLGGDWPWETRVLYASAR